MISSVIAKLNCDAVTRELTVNRIASHPALEAGDLVEDRNLPVTIDSVGHHETEQITRWMLSLDGVEFVDVVFVHFENDIIDESRDSPTKN